MSSGNAAQTKPEAEIEKPDRQEPIRLDSIGMVAAIQALTADAKEYETLRQHCRSRALECYGTDAWVARVIKGLDQLLPETS